MSASNEIEIGRSELTPVVRFAFTAFCALKHGCALFWLGDVINEERHAFWESIFRLPFAEVMAREARLIYYLLEPADEARRLASCVPA